MDKEKGPKKTGNGVTLDYVSQMQEGGGMELLGLEGKEVC